MLVSVLYCVLVGGCGGDLSSVGGVVRLLILPAVVFLSRARGQSSFVGGVLDHDHDHGDDDDPPPGSLPSPPSNPIPSLPPARRRDGARSSVGESHQGRRSAGALSGLRMP